MWLAPDGRVKAKAQQMSDAGKRARKGGDMDKERVHGTDIRELSETSRLVH